MLGAVFGGGFGAVLMVEQVDGQHGLRKLQPIPLAAGSLGCNSPLRSQQKDGQKDDAGHGRHGPGDVGVEQSRQPIAADGAGDGDGDAQQQHPAQVVGQQVGGCRRRHHQRHHQHGAHGVERPNRRHRNHRHQPIMDQPRSKAQRGGQAGVKG